MSQRDDEQKSELRVTDKRMFTPSGELREGYRDLDEPERPSAPTEAVASDEAEPPTPPEASDSANGGPESGTSTRQTPESPGRGTPLELPETPDSIGQPSFLDLLATLAEPVTIYLGDVELPDGKSAQDLRLARFYIDLLVVLRDKTQGNLSAQESAVLEDLVYRLQMRYVQKRG